MVLRKQKLVAALTMVTALLLVLPRPVAAGVVEDFTGLANGTVDSDKDGVLTLDDEGAKRGDWTGRQFSPYEVVPWGEKKTPVLRMRPDSGPFDWHAIGKRHQQDLTKATAVEFVTRIAATNVFSTCRVWLGEASENGYGLEYSRGNYNQAGIVKLRGNERKFADNDLGPTCSWTVEHNGPGDKVSVGLQQNDFITFHLRVEQEAPGKPVKLTLWYTGSSKEFPDTSYEQPAQQLLDDGSGKVFFADKDSFGPVFDLKALTYIGISCQQPKGDDAVLCIGALEVTSK